MDPHKVILTPIVTEAVFDLIESHNKLVFYVNAKSNKAQIKLAFKELFGIMPIDINTAVTPVGQKKAFLNLRAEVVALDLATEWGVL